MCDNKEFHFDYNSDEEIRCPVCDALLDKEEVKDTSVEIQFDDFDYYECPNCGVHLRPVRDD